MVVCMPDADIRLPLLLGVPNSAPETESPVVRALPGWLRPPAG